MKPTKENRKKFDIDLAYGTVREDKFIILSLLGWILSFVSIIYF